MGDAEEDNDDEPFVDKMGRLTLQLKEQLVESEKLEEIRTKYPFLKDGDRFRIEP